MKSLLILALLVSTAVSAKFINIPKYSSTIKNNTSIPSDNLSLTLELYKVKVYHPPFGLGRPAIGLERYRKIQVRVKSNGEFTLPGFCYNDQKKLYVGLRIEDANKSRINMDSSYLPTIHPADFGSWTPLPMALSLGPNFDIDIDDYKAYYGSLVLGNSSDGVLFHSQVSSNDEWIDNGEHFLYNPR